jgi:undecaprenyl phosphate-alpha-L-ara4FN deformylase
MPDRIALKVDVDTLRGTLEGVPDLVRLLSRYGLDATFLFSVGPDHTGRALRRVFRPGFVKKVMRTSVGANYGLKTLCYGTLLPGPDIGKCGRDTMRAVRAAGFEVGIHCHDHVRWQDHVRARDRDWTRRELSRAVDAFRSIFGEEPLVHGAAGWQVNDDVPSLETEFGFLYASDTRGTGPFLPVVNGAVVPCPQLPTTLPTFDEVIGLDGCTEANVADLILRQSLEPASADHVFTLHAEIEGGRLLPTFERLLVGWLERDVQLCALRAIHASLPPRLPRHAIEWRELPGRSGMLACQGPNAG